MAGVEFGVARVLQLVRPGLKRFEVGVGRRFVEALCAEARAKADERIALGGAVDVRERMRRRLERPVRLDLVGLCRKRARIAGDIARLDDRQRRAVLVHGARRPRGVCRDHAVAVEGAAIERLLLGLGGDRQEDSEGHAPGRGDRESPSCTRATHTRSKRPCLEFHVPAARI